jgi:hypothetical protein
VRTKKLLVSGCAALCVLMSGCVVAPVERPYYRGPVMVAPPPPRVEVIGPPPVVGHVWINGYWGWSGGRHEWVPGRWEAPRPGYVWAPHRWERDGEHWRQAGGHWEAHGEHGHDHDRRRDER